MSKKPIQEEELQLKAKKRRKYQDIARIQLQWLHFLWNEPDEPDMKNVERLKQMITQNCCWFNARNHIFKIINENDFNNVIQISESFIETLFNSVSNDYPKLVFWFEFRLKCFHGRHRILVAKKALHLLNKWWTIDFYLSNMLLLRFKIDFCFNSNKH